MSCEQSDVVVRAGQLFGERRDIERLLPVFSNTGIDRRYSCVPIDWYAADHGWRDRTDLYVQNATDLLENVANALLEEAGLTKDAIDAIVVSSTTGIATPSLDALVIERMGLRRDIRRLPIFGLGCAGGVIGMSRAADSRERAAGIARAVPRRRALRADVPQERSHQEQFRRHPLCSATTPRARSCRPKARVRRSAPRANTPGPTRSASWAGRSRRTG